MSIFSRKRSPGILTYLSGAVKDAKDDRDYIASVSVLDVPTEYFLYEENSDVKNQGNANSCTAHAAVTALEIQMREAKKFMPPGSELYNYYESRKLNGLFPKDSGSQLRDACKALNKFGNCPEVLMPYDVSQINTPPGFLCDSWAGWWKTASYHRVLDIPTMKKLLTMGVPVMLAIPIYRSFVSSGGVVSMPLAGEQLLGWHAICITGYADTTGFRIVNSWDFSWGNNGRAFLPFEYLTTYDFDAWVHTI